MTTPMHPQRTTALSLLAGLAIGGLLVAGTQSATSDAARLAEATNAVLRSVLNVSGTDLLKRPRRTERVLDQVGRIEDRKLCLGGWLQRRDDGHRGEHQAEKAKER